MNDLFERVLTNRSSHMSHNRSQISGEYEVIVRGLGLLTQISEGHIHRERFDALPGEERDTWWGTFSHLRVDSFNSIVSTLYLILAGCRNDAAALMRNILEAESILEYGLRFDKMKEIRRRYVFGLEKQPRTKDILRELDRNGEARLEAWSSFSCFGSHVLADRMQMNYSWDLTGRVGQVTGGAHLSRRELILETLILVQLLGSAIGNCIAFFEKYEGFLKDKGFLESCNGWLLESGRIIENAKTEFEHLR